MHTPKFVHKLREKPVHVRERILLVSMAVITPLVLTLWYSTFHLSKSEDGTSTLKTIQNTVTSASNNPRTAEVFSTYEAKKLPASAIGSGSTSDTPATLTPAPGTEGTATANGGSDTSDVSTQ